MKIVAALTASLLLLGCSAQGPPATPLLPEIDFEAVAARLEPRPTRGKASDPFPNIPLTDQHGREFRFFDDLIEDRSVVVNFMFTQCALVCPGTTSNLVRLHEAFRGAVGRDVTFLSISLDPENDTPEALHRYWKAFGSHEGWLYLRGDFEETELLRRRMGVYDLDPVIDADKTQHSGILTFGNDLTNRWAALPALSNVQDLRETIRRFAVRGSRGARPLARVAPATAEVETIYRSRGNIRAANVPRHEIVLAHEEVPGLMPAMTMTFSVSPDIPLTEFRVGQHVDFGLVNEPTGFRVVELAPTRGDGATL